MGNVNGRRPANEGHPTRLANADDVGDTPDRSRNTYPSRPLDGTGSGSKGGALDEAGFRGNPGLGRQRSLANLKGARRSGDSGCSRDLGSAWSLGNRAEGEQLHERSKQKDEN